MSLKYKFAIFMLFKGVWGVKWWFFDRGLFDRVDFFGRKRFQKVEATFLIKGLLQRCRCNFSRYGWTFKNFGSVFMFKVTLSDDLGVAFQDMRLL